MADAITPPPGYTMDSGSSGAITPPPGYTLDQPHPPSALKRFAQGVGDVLNPMPLIKQYASKQGLKDVLTMGPAGPIARGMIEGAVDQGKQAVQAVKDKRYSEAIGHGVAAVVPGVGPMAANAAETMGGEPGKMDKYGNEAVPTKPPDVARGLGQGAAVLGGVIAPEVARAVKPPVAAAAGAVTDSLRSAATRIEPKQAMTQALKPKSTNLGFESALDRALPELKQTEQIAGTPINDLQTLSNAVDLSKKRVWSQYEKISGQQAQRGIDASPVGDAMLQAIPEKSAAQRPSVVGRVAQMADAYKQPLTIQQLEGYLQTANAELDTYYAKYPAARGVNVRGNPLIAARVAEAEALRDTLYRALDDPADGAAPRELKQRYGSLMNVEREIQRRQNVANRQQPDSLSQQVSKWSAAGDVASGVLRGSPVDIVRGLAKTEAAKWIKEQQTTDALIRRAFEHYKGSPTPIQMPPPFQPKALIGQGDMITPPPADTSYVRGVPGLPSPPNPMKALPPARDIITPPPPDTSFVRGVPATPLPVDPRFRQSSSPFNRQGAWFQPPF